MSRARRARTSGSLARDLGESVGSAAYLGALTRTASGPFDLELCDRSRADPFARGRRPGRSQPSFLRPIDAGLDAFPVVVLNDAEVAAVAKGQFVRPAAGLPGAADQIGSPMAKAGSWRSPRLLRVD